MIGAAERQAPAQARLGCRVHGSSCRVPWGYDDAHTDSPRPYTLDELDARRLPPHRFAYPSLEAYLAGWELWRALKRDEAPTADEWEMLFRVRMERIAERAPEWLRVELRRQFLDGGTSGG